MVYFCYHCDLNGENNITAFSEVAKGSHELSQKR
jgi:hypothetical protein